MDPLSLTQSKEDDTDLRCPCYCEENVWRLLERRRQLHPQRHSSMSTSTSSSSSISTSRPEQHYYVVFISNENQTVAMLHQKAASNTSEEGFIVWDYHVILLGYAAEQKQSLSDEAEEQEVDDTAAPSMDANYDPTNESSSSNGTSKNRSRRNIEMTMLVYDLDTTLQPYPMPLADYLDRSFPSRTGSSTSTVRSSTMLMMRKQPPQLYRPQFRIVPAQEFRHYFASDRSHMWNAATGQYNAPPPPYECITTTAGSISSSSSNRTSTIIGADAPDTADDPVAKQENHHYGSPALQTNTLPYYLNFQDDHQRQHPPCPLPKEALGIILSLDEFYQVDRWRSRLA
jgi:N-terminal glutamine amidase